MQRSFLKWAGGKSSVFSIISQHFDKNADVFVEPFCGSGVVWLNTDFPKYIVADLNADLMNTFSVLKQQKVKFINYCEKFFINGNDKTTYYSLRNKFNSTTDKTEKAALFVYLNRHCFNGLCRYNASGEFNVPMGQYSSVYFPRNEMEFFVKKAQKADFYCCDFEKIFDKVKNLNYTMYCDPPYIPSSDTSNFTAYVKNGFNYTDHQKLYGRISNADKRIVVSNSFPAKKLYAGLSIIEVENNRNIGASKGSRKKVKEIVGVKN